jgi:Xaa-Pro aminopeptidase
MVEENLSAIVAVCNTGHNEAYQADVRYLSHIGGFATEATVCFPTEGEPTAWIRGDTSRARWWCDAQNWVQDVRPSDCSWGNDLSGRLLDLGLGRARIGVVGLGAVLRSPEGTVLYGTMEALRRRLPDAQLVDATELMVTCRALKSAEEIAFLQKATEIAEASVRAAADAAAPGTPENVAYAAMVHSMLVNGGELPTMILWRSGPEPIRPDRVPTTRRLQRGDVIVNEVEAKYGGYIAQVRRPIAIGEPSDAVAEMHWASVEAFHVTYLKMRPGATFGLLLDTYNEFVDDWRYERSYPLLHGRGLGEDIPLLRDTEEIRAERLQTGNVFILGPTVRRGAERLSWGDTVAITERGARRLGKGRGDLIIT